MSSSPDPLQTALCPPLDILHTTSPTQPPLHITCHESHPPLSELPPGFVYMGCGMVTAGLPALAGAYAAGSVARRSLDVFHLTLVLTVADETQPDARVPLPREFIPMRDFAGRSSVDAISRAVTALHGVIATGKYVLLVDRFNVSRAPAVAAAYLMCHAHASLSAALAHVSAMHPRSNISLDMQHALRNYEESVLRRESVITPVALKASFVARHPSLGSIPTPAAKGVAVEGEEAGASTPLTPSGTPCALELSRAQHALAVRNAFTVHDMDHCPASLILPDLWVGDVDASADCSWLATHGIRVVVNCAAECGPKTTCNRPTPCDVCGAGGGSPLSRHAFPIVENAFFDATTSLRAAAEAIHAARCRGHPVLVHCMVGMNRSVSAVVTYMMAFHGLTLLDALTFVRARRAISYPNAEMFPNLLRLERELLRDALSARQAELPSSVLDLIPPDVHRMLVVQADSIRRPPIVFGIHAADEAQDPALKDVRGTIPSDSVQWLHKRLFRGGVKALEQIWGE